MLLASVAGAAWYLAAPSPQGGSEVFAGSSVTQSPPQDDRSDESASASTPDGQTDASLDGLIDPEHCVDSFAIPALPVGGNVGEQLANLDPQRAGWDSEAFSEQAELQLKALGKLLAHPELIDADHVAPLVAADFHSEPLRAEPLVEAYRDGALTVLRSATPSDPVALRGERPGSHRGVEGMIEALRELARPLQGAPDVRSKFKIIQVEATETGGRTVAYFEVSGRSEQRGVQENATWHCQWRRGADGGPPLLEWIGVEHYEEVLLDAPGGVMFTDRTVGIVGANDCYEKQLVHGMNYWGNRLQQLNAMDYYGLQGLAVGDVNGDGLDDLYVCQPAGLPNLLFLQNPDGTVTEVAGKAGVDYLDRSRSALLVDLNNNGHQDLIVVVGMRTLILENDGTGRFTEQSIFTPQLFTQEQNLAVADYDNDGDLDIYIGQYGFGAIGWGFALPYHDANNGIPNYLLRNDGNWKFTDVTEAVGLNENNRRWTHAPCWEDFDNDGYQDLYVANDYGRNNLYHNQGGHFTDVAPQAGVEDIAAGMSASWGDFNGDGFMDLYVGNMFSSAGSRITHQQSFKSNASADTRSMYQRHAKGNTLFLNNGDGTFEDVSYEAGVTMGRWSWCSKAVDLNNNGLDDLVIANGLVSQDDSGDL